MLEIQCIGHIALLPIRVREIKNIFISSLCILGLCGAADPALSEVDYVGKFCMDM